MASVVRMPEVLAGATEAVLSTWSVAEGAEVAVGDVLAEIETEKATVEYQAEEAGTLARFLIKPGDSADVGTPIAIFTSPGDGDPEIDQALADAGVNSAPAVEVAPAPVAEILAPTTTEGVEAGCSPAPWSGAWLAKLELISPPFRAPVLVVALFVRISRPTTQALPWHPLRRKTLQGMWKSPTPGCAKRLLDA
jgi:pyruvate/2-oxoglutarate dehydrogenase complex dihydrolipoamide acyltransferase (E2) component